MLSIDTYAYTNRLKKVHPIEKTLFALITLVICLGFEEMDLYVFVIASMSLITVAGAGIPVRLFKGVDFSTAVCTDGRAGGHYRFFSQSRGLRLLSSTLLSVIRCYA